MRRPAILPPIRSALAVLGLALAWPALSAAQGAAPPSTQSLERPGDCAPAAQAEPATPPAPGADSTAPGNDGTTGWTGGLGGSQIGTNPSGKTSESVTWQPPTARGLDLKGRPEPASQADC